MHRGAGGVSWGDTSERMGLEVCGIVDGEFGRTRRGLFEWSVSLSTSLEILAVEETCIVRGWMELHCSVFVYMLLLVSSRTDWRSEKKGRQSCLTDSRYIVAKSRSKSPDRCSVRLCGYYQDNVNSRFTEQNLVISLYVENIHEGNHDLSY